MNRRILLALTVVLGLVTVSTPAWVSFVPGPSVVAEKPTVTAEPTRPSLPSPAADPPSLPYLLVTVRDADTEQLLPGADVRIGEQEGSTDELGQCVLGVRSGGTHTVVVWYPGYDRWQGQVDITRPGSEMLAVNVSLEPNTVRGQVVNSRRRPLPDATVTLNQRHLPLDGEARFVLRRVKVGDVVTAEHPGYLLHQATFDGYPTLYLPLEPVSVAVSVNDALTGQAIADVPVCADDDLCQLTDKLGNVILSPVVHGASLTASRQRYQTKQVTYQGKDALTIELAPRELVGVIRDEESGQPLTNTLLFVNGQLTPVDEDGRYHLPDLTQVYTLFVKSPGHRRVTIPMGPRTKTSRYRALDPCQEPRQLPCADINLARFAVRGIYINFGLLWNKGKLLSLIDLVDRSPILNAIVLDIKGDFGYIAFESSDPIVASSDAMTSPRVPLTEFLRICREKRIYTIGRVVVFKDSPLIKARPELAVRHPNGAIFYDREGMAWADPTLEEVWEYNIAITKEAIRLGFDEIQYDYLRYPSDSTSLAVVRALVYSVPSTRESRTAAIEGFVAAAKAAVDPTPAFLSADLFGYALSVDPEHDMRIGQRLKDLAPHVDYICPMVYPSTFIPGNLGLMSPSDSPYEVVAISMEYGHARTSTLIRPWLQHYWYDRYEFAEQRRAAEEATDIGWCFWNAGGRYDELFFIPPRGIEP